MITPRETAEYWSKHLPKIASQYSGATRAAYGEAAAAYAAALNLNEAALHKAGRLHRAADRSAGLSGCTDYTQAYSDSALKSLAEQRFDQRQGVVFTILTPPLNRGGPTRQDWEWVYAHADSCADQASNPTSSFRMDPLLCIAVLIGITLMGLMVGLP